MLSPGVAPLLAVEGLQAWYGESHVLHGATFEVLAGEVVTLRGRNGAGKTIGMLKRQGFTVLLVEQNFRFASTVADRYYVMENGRIIDRFANAELEANLGKLHDYLGV